MARSRNGEWTYGALAEMIGARESKKIAGNTWATRDGEAIVVRFWATNIATLYPDGRVRLNSGGYHTVTTKARLNAVLPGYMGVSQRDYVWYLRTWGSLGDSETPFTDGMVIDTATGRVVGDEIAACPDCGGDPLTAPPCVQFA